MEYRTVPYLKEWSVILYKERSQNSQTNAGYVYRKQNEIKRNRTLNLAAWKQFLNHQFEGRVTRM
jgi:hypothetical protein